MAGDEKLLRMTPCKVKTFAQVKEGTLYTTSQRLLCVTIGGDQLNLEFAIALGTIFRAEVNAEGKLKVKYNADYNGAYNIMNRGIGQALSQGLLLAQPRTR
jgi:hypothetical protein